jgi:hypothetical protein
MVRLLAIGNSFSEDATYYLHQILASAGVENQVINLYIGGCPLERHWENIEKDACEYQLQLDGVKTERYVSIHEALKEFNPDHVILHQASHDSGWEVSYEPFLELIPAYLAEQAPQAKVWLNQTWAYEPDSKHPRFVRYNRSQQEMYEKLSFCYRKMAGKYHLPLIPSGDMIQKLRSMKEFNPEQGGMSICRDGFHMSFLYGRYALASMWARAVFKVDADRNTYIPKTEYLPEACAEQSVLDILKKTVDTTAEAEHL